MDEERYIDEIDLREVAAELRRDLRTVKKVYEGRTVRGKLAEAEIKRAIHDRLRKKQTT